jgi:hypothetical protein
MQPIIIELVGIGGAGKSSLRRVLKEINPRIQLVGPPNKLYYLPFLLSKVLKWRIIHLCRYRHSRWFNLQETRLLFYLGTWLPYLQRKAKKENIIIILDPGPVYWLSALREFGPDIVRSPFFLFWWREALVLWAGALSLLIYLDAPNELLLERILSRAEWHEAKQQTKNDALNYFSRYRKWNDFLTQLMNRYGNLDVYKFQTHKWPTRVIVDKLVTHINLAELHKVGCGNNYKTRKIYTEF